MAPNDDEDHDRGHGDDEDMGEKLVAPPDFDGPTSDRKCTDILCLVLIVVMWISMTMLGVYAIMNGDARLVLSPLDYDGNLCGTRYGSQDMRNYPYLYSVNNYGGGICVENCPKIGKNDTSDGVTDMNTLLTYGGTWQTTQAELPPDFVKYGNYTGSDALFCTAATCFPNVSDPTTSWTSDGINEGYGFAYYVADSYDILGYCVLTTAANDRIAQLVEANATLTVTDDVYAVWTKFLADVYTAWQYIFGFGLGLSFFISFLYISILRLPYLLNAIIWGSIFGVIILTFAAGGYSLYSANSWATEVPQIWSDRSITATRIAGYVLFGLGAFFVLLMCCLRKQIQLAIGCVKETGKAVQRMVFIIFLPVLQGAGFVLFMLAFVVYGIYLASLGTLETTEFPLNLQGLTITVRSYNFADWVTRAAWYLLFCLYWTANFIVAAGDMMVAMSIAKWYFTRNKRKTGNSTVIKSVCDTLYFHSGTLAFGSLLVAIIQLIRTLLARVQREVKKANSKIADCLLCCCQCCLWCFEKCIKFINKNAYIQTAIFGTSFCVSARHAFFLILRNIGRIGAVSYVSGAVLVMGKLFISGITTVVTYYLMSELLGGELFSVAGPTILVFIMSYVIADMFLDVFELGISTILHCFVADEEMFDGEECFAEGDLQDWINKYEENFNK